jgi:single-strand DNA-binding protein
MRVVVTGTLKQRSFETREGEKHTEIELDVDEVGPSLRYATARVNRTQRGSTAASATDDPWVGGNATGPDEAPF